MTAEQGWLQLYHGIIFALILNREEGADMKYRRCATLIKTGTTYARPIEAGTAGGSGIFGNRRGVTLVELLIVLALIAIVVALAAPEIGDYRTSINANRAISDILADMQLARTGAIFKNNHYRLTFDTTPDGEGVYWYRIHKKPLGVAWGGVETELVKENALPFGIEYGLCTGVTGPGGATSQVVTDGISFADNYVIFQNTGSADKTGFAYIMPQKDKSPKRTDRMRAIRIEFIPTAKVKSYKYATAAWTNATAWTDF
jgi:prepilin-type N-terminal cleavage/methylation domain-containing protein